MPRVYIESVRDLTGRVEKRIVKVGDGSIIKLFDRTPVPTKKTDVVCPHFLELKWANGCPFSCAWCYLQGTFRPLLSPLGSSGMSWSIRRGQRPWQTCRFSDQEAVEGQSTRKPPGSEVNVQACRVVSVQHERLPDTQPLTITNPPVSELHIIPHLGHDFVVL